MTSEDTYLSVQSPSTGLYKEKGSRFLAFLFPVTSAEQARTEIERIRKEYHDARHHCFGYRIGLRGDIWRINDDGEPSSTAGKPIFGQILSNSLSDILIIVVRYFGGIKLGVPGLINAYRSAAADAIANSTIITKTATVSIRIDFGYPSMNDVMKLIKESGAEITHQQFDLQCSICVNVRLRDEKDFISATKKISDCVLKIQPILTTFGS